MLRFTTTALVLVVVTAQTVATQLRPSLSGQWALVAASGSASNARPAEVLAVREIVDTTTATGAAMPPALRALTIERRTGAETTRTTIQVGIEGGQTGVTPSASPGESQVASQSQWSTRWVDAHLIVWRLERTDAGGQVVEMETTEDWSINEAGHLVITTRVRQTGQEPVRTVLSYQRQ